MISFVQGTLAAREGDLIVVQAGPVGLNIHVPLTVIEQLPKTGEEVMIHTYLKVAEDALTLYGFLHQQDREMFCRLINVNGIGPKGALAILSTLTPDDLRMAVLTGDAKAISRAPGVGMKTAQRIILDLKDKVSFEDLESCTYLKFFAGGGGDRTGLCAHLKFFAGGCGWKAWPLYTSEVFRRRGRGLIPQLASVRPSS